MHHSPFTIRHPLQRAFTLIEMSIVVAVIGLLMGGVLVGKNMYRTAKLQQTVANASQFGNALRSFRSTYNSMPGDMHNATDYWGAAGGVAPYTGVDCTAINSLTLTDIRNTCNGTGNGVVGETAGTHYERFRAYQHLANASMIAGRYTGVTTAGGTARYTAGVNSMAGPLSNSIYGFAHVRNNSGSASGTFGGAYFGTVVIGAQTTDTFLNYGGPLFTANETSNIDQKVDDGMPGTGDMLPSPPNLCTDASSFPAAVYDTPEAYSVNYLKTNAYACSIYWRNFL